MRMMNTMEVELVASAPSMAFTVGNRSEWLAIYFDYEEHHTGGEMRLTDPRGKLRFAYMDMNSPRQALIHRSKELTSYLGVPGDIEAGEWKLEFLRKPPKKFKLEWEWGDGAGPSAVWSPSFPRDYWTDGCKTQKNFTLNLYDWHECREIGNRWYKGDTHAHTVLSDGRMTPEQTMEQAEKKELDYFFTTEHNVLASSWPRGKALVIPGMEFTSFGRGDWNALGLGEWIDCWGTGTANGGMHTSEGQVCLLEEVGALGVIRNINHPLIGIFAWRYPEMPLTCMDTMEIWNSPTKSNRPSLTEQTLMLWSILWNEGYRVPGLGGSDAHFLPTESYEEGGELVSIGDPATYVYAERLTAADILQGIRAGHVYVSRGPTLEVSIVCGGQAFTFGDDLTKVLQPDTSKIVECRLTVSNAVDCKLIVIENGQKIEVHEMNQPRQQSFDLSFSWEGHEYVWRRFEIRAADGKLLAFSNPVSYGKKQPRIRTWKELLEELGIEL
jgi:hypothetical protein